LNPVSPAFADSFHWLSPGHHPGVVGLMIVGRNKERGATLIEMAMIFPLMVLVLIGIIELGMAFKDYLAVSAASREGARIAALAGTNDQADCAVLVGIANLVSQGDLDRLDRIEIFHAEEGTGNQLAVNVAHLEPANDQSVCSQPHGLTDGWRISPIGYPPTSRQTTVGSSDLEIVGVRVIMTRSWLTGFPPFRGSFAVDGSTITRLEPEAFGP
jgi:hypothetical protein